MQRNHEADDIQSTAIHAKHYLVQSEKRDRNNCVHHPSR